MTSNHFSEKDALTHVIEKRLKGAHAHAESHGIETPSNLAAVAEAIREMGFLFLLLWIVMNFFAFSSSMMISIFIPIAFGTITWKTAKSAWMGWSRLEHFHRLIEQEKYEIEHHRQQEREELTAIYQLKGFHGKLLEDVVDFIMADTQRLLKVMLEDELGLSIESYQHPLKQALGVFLSSLLTIIISLSFFWIFPKFGIPIASAISIGGGSFIYAFHQKNKAIPAIIWTMSIALLACMVVFFLLSWMAPS